MKNMKLKSILLILSLVLAAALSGCGNTTGTAEPAPQQPQEQAPSAAEKALAAYQEILKANPAVEGEHEEFSDASFDYEKNAEKFGDHLDQFAVVDINNDEVPELIALTTVNFRWTPVSVYTFADDKAVLLKDPADAEAHGTFEQYSGANGSYVTYICEENHIHSVWRGMNPLGEEVEENQAFALNDAALTAVDCSAAESEKTIYFGDVAKVNTAENAEAITK